MAKTARATNESGTFRTTIRAGRFELHADEPVDLGGTDTAPAPYDLLLAALGACTTITIRSYAQRKGWPLAHVDVQLTYRRADATQGRPRDVIERVLTFDGALDDVQRERLVEIARRCPVSRTLAAGVDHDTRSA